MEKIKNKLLALIKDNKILIIILLISFMASIFYSFHFQMKLKVDARAYDLIGWNLVQGNGYRESLDGSIERDYAITRIGPLYQFTLAGIYKIFGHHYEAVWIFHAILHTLTAWLMYLIAMLIFKTNENKKKIALLATAIIGFYPDLIEISAMVLIETFYLFLFSLALYVFFRYFNKDNILSAVLLGLTFGLATLTRPPVLFLIPIILFYFYQKKKLLLGAIFVVTLLLVFTPWTVRNYNMYDRVAPFGVGGAFNFWIGNYHGANGEQEPPAEAWAYAKEYGIIEMQDESIRQFTGFVKEYPLEFTKLTFLRANKYFSIIRPMGWWFYQSGWGQFVMLLSSAIASIILLVFSLGGIIKSIKLNNEQLKYLTAFTIITPLIIFITVIETRYRFQIYPLLAIFASYFIVYLLNKKKFWLSKIFWIAVALIFGNGLLDMFLSWERFSGRLDKFF